MAYFWQDPLVLELFVQIAVIPAQIPNSGPILLDADEGEVTTNPYFSHIAHVAKRIFDLGMKIPRAPYRAINFNAREVVASITQGDNLRTSVRFFAVDEIR